MIELMTIALTTRLSIGLGVAGARALLAALFFLTAHPIVREPRTHALVAAPDLPKLSLRAPAA